MCEFSHSTIFVKNLLDVIVDMANYQNILGGGEIAEHIHTMV